MSPYLSKYFQQIAAKRLAEVETDPTVSNQHEFNGVGDFKNIFGTEKIRFKGKFILLDDDPDNIITDHGDLTWYDARENHPTRTEYRLYYSSNEVISESNPGDLVVIGKTSDSELTVLVAPEGSTSEQQLLWLFNITSLSDKFQVRDILLTDTELNYAGKAILSHLGMDPYAEDTSHLDEMLYLFNAVFPSTALFSEYTRSKVAMVSLFEEPDKTLIKWLDKEEALFRALEKHLVSKQLEIGFSDNVDFFIKFSLSVHNRRKSRAGHSFEHHLNALFLENSLLFSKGKRTERKNKPDFLFPGISMYQNPQFPEQLLTMLGVKTTAKDRWRQILSEAERIPEKHLITLEPAISSNQTTEMREQGVQLVLPSPIMETYTSDQKSNIINLAEFIELVKHNQKKINA